MLIAEKGLSMVMSDLGEAHLVSIVATFKQKRTTKMIRGLVAKIYEEWL